MIITTKIDKHVFVWVGFIVGIYTHLQFIMMLKWFGKAFCFSKMLFLGDGRAQW